MKARPHHIRSNHPSETGFNIEECRLCRVVASLLVFALCRSEL